MNDNDEKKQCSSVSIDDPRKNDHDEDYHGFKSPDHIPKYIIIQKSSHNDKTESEDSESIRKDFDSIQRHILLPRFKKLEIPYNQKSDSVKKRSLQRNQHNNLSRTSSPDVKELKPISLDELNQNINKKNKNSMKPSIKDNLRNRFHKIETALKKKASNIKNKQSWTKLNFFTPKKKIDPTMKPISKQHSTTHMVNSNTNQNDLDVSLSFMSHNSKFLPDNYENLIKMLKDLKNSDSDENFNSEKAEISNSFNCLSSVGPTCLPLDIDKIETLPENKSENYKNNDNYDNYSSHGIWNRIKSIPKLEFIKNKFPIKRPSSKNTQIQSTCLSEKKIKTRNLNQVSNNNLNDYSTSVDIKNTSNLFGSDSTDEMDECSNHMDKFWNGFISLSKSQVLTKKFPIKHPSSLNSEIQPKDLNDKKLKIRNLNQARVSSNNLNDNSAQVDIKNIYDCSKPDSIVEMDERWNGFKSLPNSKRFKIKFPTKRPSSKNSQAQTTLPTNLSQNKLNQTKNLNSSKSNLTVRDLKSTYMSNNNLNDTTASVDITNTNTSNCFGSDSTDERDECSNHMDKFWSGFKSLSKSKLLKKKFPIKLQSVKSKTNF